jgi:hypothetical protein
VILLGKFLSLTSFILPLMFVLNKAYFTFDVCTKQSLGAFDKFHIGVGALAIAIIKINKIINGKLIYFQKRANL